jgi:hypothetical protein
VTSDVDTVSLQSFNSVREQSKNNNIQVISKKFRNNSFSFNYLLHKESFRFHGCCFNFTSNYFFLCNALFFKSINLRTQNDVSTIGEWLFRFQAYLWCRQSVKKLSIICHCSSPISYICHLQNCSVLAGQVICICLFETKKKTIRRIDQL